MSYPLINDNDFQKKILIKYKQFEIPSNKPSFNDLCFPEKFKLQLPQIFVSKFINPKTPYKGLLIYHKIGAGKTCAAIRIAEEWKDKKKIVFVVPASLITNLYKELRSECTGNDYITDIERKKLLNLIPNSKEYINIINIVHNRIDKKYEIYSYNKYTSLIIENKINLKDKILIIDEVQNIVSQDGLFYNTILQSIKKSPLSTRVILLSATPIFDKPVEFALTLNLLRPEKTLPTGNEFNEIFLKKTKYGYKLKNINLLKDMIRGYISYYPGAPHYAFPKKILKIVRCRMLNFQWKSYLTLEKNELGTEFDDILKLGNNFLLGSRIISNIAYPNKNINELGFASFNNKNLLLKNIKKFSIKFYKIFKKINKIIGPSFVYSNFKEYGGIKPFIVFLEANGYVNFINNGPGKKRFAIWSGDESFDSKEYIKEIFNNINNKDGSQIKLLLGTPSIKEGVSLLRVRSVHILEPYWNISRLEQIIGRAIRFCSHKDLNKNERQVEVYIYIASSPLGIKHKTVDEYIYKIALEKEKLINDFLHVIKKSSVDYYLMKNAENFI
jgi:hypothetical protein